jgi:hypothetical protein
MKHIKQYKLFESNNEYKRYIIEKLYVIKNYTINSDESIDVDHNRYDYSIDGGNYYFITDNLFEYKVMINSFKDGNLVDFAVYDSNNDIYSFDVRPKVENIEKLSNTIVSIMRKIGGKFYLISNTFSKYRLYKIMLNKISIRFSEESSLTGINKIIVEF